MANNVADFVVAYWVPMTATLICLIPAMILEELEIHRTKTKRRRRR